MQTQGRCAGGRRVAQHAIRTTVQSGRQPVIRGATARHSQHGPGRVIWVVGFGPPLMGRELRQPRCTQPAHHAWSATASQKTCQDKSSGSGPHRAKTDRLPPRTPSQPSECARLNPQPEPLYSTTSPQKNRGASMGRLPLPIPTLWTHSSFRYQDKRAGCPRNSFRRCRTYASSSAGLVMEGGQNLECK